MQSAQREEISGKKVRGPKAAALTFLLSYLSLAGVALSIASLKAFGDWSRWQFLGLFGVIEGAVGIAAIIAPNVWRLPVAQIQTNESTDVELAASTTFIPHWSGVGRAVAGISMVAGAALHEGLDVSSITLVPFILATAFSVFALSALFAYAGVTHVDIDVIQIIFRRGGGQELALPPFSIGASILHLLISVSAIPITKFVSHEALFKPAMAVGTVGLLVSLLSAVVLGMAGTYFWRQRLSWKAPPAQQREAEKAV